MMYKRDALPKINWSLAVEDRREDGYHLLDMLMQTVDIPGLKDTLLFERDTDLRLFVEGEAPPGAVEDNLVLRAARLLREALQTEAGAVIRLTKGIPAGAGLGGGSADAAATLLGLCELWGMNPPEDRLRSIALRLGADVPFMLQGGLARVGGIGEIVEPVEAERASTLLDRIALIIVQPDAGVSTPEVFAAYDKMERKPDNPDMDKVQSAFISQKPWKLYEFLGNALEPAAIALQPEIGECMYSLQQHGATAARMTGSGSAVFGVFLSTEAAGHAYAFCAKRWRKTWLKEIKNETAGAEGEQIVDVSVTNK